MFKKDQPIIIEGQVFNHSVFEYLLNRFKEAFSHSSLSIEAAFAELEEVDLTIENTKNESANEYYHSLSLKERHAITEVMHQIIVYKGSQYAVFAERLTGEQKQIERLYKEYLSYFEPYLYYYAVFDENGEFDKTSTFRNLDTLFFNLPQRQRVYEHAYNMKKDNLNAFDYAMKLGEISISDVIIINDLVNENDEDKVPGFKRTNNVIFGATFTPVDKKNVPVELQRLFADYKNGMGYDIKDPNEKGLSAEERYERVCNIIRREAEFHIRFERIHPFNDGNGRTGRIILNRNLLRQGVAPVLITDVMSSDYKKYINDYDIESLAKMFLSSSSQQLTNWVSFKKYANKGTKPNINNDELAKISDKDEIGAKVFGKKYKKN